MSVFIVAELSGNHHQSLATARELIHAAKEAGADAVKFQTFTPELLAVDNPKYTTVQGGLWAGRTLLDLYRETHLPREWHAELFGYARDLGLVAFSSPFHPSDVDFLETLDCPIYKIASPEIADIPLIERIIETKKPVIASTGMANYGDLLCDVGDVERISLMYDKAGLNSYDLTFLHCVSEYPAQSNQFGLRSHMLSPASGYGCSVGLSDHSLTPTAAVCAVALGATVIEKHLCLRRSDGGPDSGFSLEPEEFRGTVEMIREAEKCLAHGSNSSKESSLAWVRKSLWVVKDAKAGEPITADNVRCLRPGNGLPPSEYGRLLSRGFQRDVKAGEPLTGELVRNA
jgi:pseudaminic acid synthase